MNRQTITKFLLAILAISSVSFGKENLHFDREKAAIQSSCLLEGTDEYSLHLFRGGVHRHTDGYVIAHIAHKTSKITWLYSSGLSDEPTRRISYRIKKIRGILIHKNYLYILVYESSRFITDKYDTRPDPRELRSHLQKVALRGCFKMIVFNNKNGEKVGEYTYTEPIYKPPSIDLFYSDFDHLGHGPISINDKGIECFGVIFTIEGKKLVSLSPSITNANTGSLIFSIQDVKIVRHDVTIVPSTKRITLVLEFKTQEGPVLFDTYFPEYHISLNGSSFIDLGPIKWRHPFKGEDLKTISVESPYIMTYDFYVPYNIEEIKTIKMRVVRGNRNDELVEFLTQIGYENPDKYKNAWFGQVTSQEFIIETTTE